jgi:stearoyl-CoA desaturase (Delta-9 desaturase)
MHSSKINWYRSFILILFPIVGVISLFYWIKNGYYNLNTIILAIAGYSLIGISITAGYHRLFSHRTYKSHWLIRFFFLIFGAGALQGPAILWCIDHRHHHAFTDHPEKDPYSIKRGFLWAHIGWLFFKHYKALLTKENIDRHKDLFHDTLLVWQMNYEIILGFSVAIFLPALIALSWGDFWGGFLIAGVLRSTLNHHATFLVNSLAHSWGNDSHNKTISACDNLFISILTLGEGYHNYHHQFPSDYRNGHRWFHWDPTKWFISSMSIVGLAKKLKRQVS